MAWHLRCQCHGLTQVFGRLGTELSHLRSLVFLPQILSTSLEAFENVVAATRMASSGNADPDKQQKNETAEVGEGIRRWEAASSIGAKLSRRIKETNSPTVVDIKKYVGNRTNVLSLGQGFVHWKPPEEALQAGLAVAKTDPLISCYGQDEGLPQLREKLREKIVVENGLYDYDVMVTVGAQQAFINIVLTCCDHGDRVVLFKPYYFNHIMLLQMTGSKPFLIEGPCCPTTFHPDLEWLEKRFNEPDPPKLVVIVNPCNPTGVVMSKEELDTAARVCEENGAWLVVDNAYEYFLFDGNAHYCPRGPNVFHVFSFSKSYGLMGWRVGYVAFPAYDGDQSLCEEMVKVQDSLVICPVLVSQHVALACLSIGRTWVDAIVKSLDSNRQAVMEALEPLGTKGNGVYGGEGGIYFWAKLPEGHEDDNAVVEWLIHEHAIAVIPGSSCGSPGYIRVSFANQELEQCKRAGARLKKGLTALVEGGLAEK